MPQQRQHRVLTDAFSMTSGILLSFALALFVLVDQHCARQSTLEKQSCLVDRKAIQGHGRKSFAYCELFGLSFLHALISFPGFQLVIFCL